MNRPLTKPEFGDLLRPPGGMMIWIFIFLEIVTFGVVFVAFSVLRARDLSVFESSQAQLDQSLGLINTLVLLTSGYLVVLANHRYDRDQKQQATRWLAGAIGLGTVFVILKAIEYRDKIAHGLTTGVNQFFDFYWLLTGFHLSHVLIGIVLLIYMRRKIRKGEPFAAPDLNLKTGSAFWHLCDLIWVLLFAILYLI